MVWFQYRPPPPAPDQFPSNNHLNWVVLAMSCISLYYLAVAGASAGAGYFPFRAQPEKCFNKRNDDVSF